jgi:fructokinase
MAIRIGVDLGGTKIEAVALGEGGALLRRRRVATPRGDYQGTLEAVAALVHEFEEGLGQVGSVGVGIPGALAPGSGLVKNSNCDWLLGQPFDRDLSARLVRPVRLANDANCFALSEATDGAGAGHRLVFGVILGTGCGGGLVVDGRIHAGPNAVAGEWGHNPVPWPEPGEWPGPPCGCGRTGCIEGFVSGSGLARDFREATGERAEPREIVRRAEAGDGAAEAALARLESRLARGLAAVVNTLDPDVIVLGGGLSNVARLYRNVPERWSRWAFGGRIDTPLRPAVHGDSSGVRGAAWLW